MTLDEALEALRSHIEPGRDAQMAKYHKIDRPYLGLSNTVLNDLSKVWRRNLETSQRVDLAAQLWATNIFEARLVAAKLLTQARIRPDDSAAWTLIKSWAPDWDSWAIADHACMAGMRRLSAEPSRIDEVQSWTQSDHLWTKRAALVITLPWTKQNNPNLLDLEIRDRVLTWAAEYTTDHQWFIQKAVAWWLRELSKHDARRVVAFMDAHGSKMKAFAQKEALRHLNK